MFLILREKIFHRGFFSVPYRKMVGGRHGGKKQLFPESFRFLKWALMGLGCANAVLPRQ